jgi:hypothetical protein
VRDLRKKAKTYIPPAEELESSNRQQRRHVINLHEIHWSLFVGVGMIAVLLLWYLLSLAAMAYQNVIYNPGTYGPGHGNTAHITVKGQSYYLEGMNADGQSYIIVVPNGQPAKTHMLVGEKVAKDRFVDLETRDVNGDGKDDIIEHVIAPPQPWHFTPSEQDYIFYGDGNGNFSGTPKQ